MMISLNLILQFWSNFQRTPLLSRHCGVPVKPIPQFLDAELNLAHFWHQKLLEQNISPLSGMLMLETQLLSEIEIREFYLPPLPPLTPPHQRRAA